MGPVPQIQYENSRERGEIKGRFCLVNLLTPEFPRILTNGVFLAFVSETAEKLTWVRRARQLGRH